MPRLSALTLCAMIVSSPVAASDAKLVIIPPPQGAFNLAPNALSGNGKVFVGGISGFGPNSQAFRWKNNEFHVIDATFEGIPSITAQSVNVSGRAFAGFGSGASHPTEAIRWSLNEGITRLGALDGHDVSLANAINADGSVLVGTSRMGNDFSTNRAFRWTQSGGMQELGPLPGHGYSTAYGVSGDGAVVVGSSALDSSAPTSSVRWIEGVAHDLGTIRGGADVYSEALAVSADGSVIVGYEYSDDTNHSTAYRWTELGGVESLGFLDGALEFYPTALSADGSVIVGESSFGSGSQAFLWTESGGLRLMADVLSMDFGFDLDGVQLQSVVGVSADGSVFVGRGLNSDGSPMTWMFIIPTPSGALALACWAALGARRRSRPLPAM